MLDQKFNNLIGLPELEFYKKSNQQRNILTLYARKRTKKEVCPKCATLSTTCYDKPEVTIKDTLIRSRIVYLKIMKRRLFL